MLEHPALLPQAASQSSGVAQATNSTSNDKVVDYRSGVVHCYSMWSELPQCLHFSKGTICHPIYRSNKMKTTTTILISMSFLGLSTKEDHINVSFGSNL